MQRQKDSPVRNHFFSFVALFFLGLDWILTGLCSWTCCWISCWIWACLQRKGWLLEWDRLLKWDCRLLKWGCLVKLDHSLDCPLLEGQPALVKAEVSLLSRLIPVLGTNRCFHEHASHDKLAQQGPLTPVISPNLSMGDRIHEQCSMEPPRCPGRRKNPCSGLYNLLQFLI
jgi:hypothetical protein